MVLFTFFKDLLTISMHCLNQFTFLEAVHKGSPFLHFLANTYRVPF